MSRVKLGQCGVLNNSVKHWPIFVIFGVQHHKETSHKRLWYFCPFYLTNVATLRCEMHMYVQVPTHRRPMVGQHVRLVHMVVVEMVVIMEEGSGVEQRLVVYLATCLVPALSSSNTLVLLPMAGVPLPPTGAGIPLVGGLGHHGAHREDGVMETAAAAQGPLRVIY